MHWHRVLIAHFGDYLKFIFHTATVTQADTGSASAMVCHGSQTNYSKPRVFSAELDPGLERPLLPTAEQTITGRIFLQRRCLDLTSR